jgi:cytochrome b involved in lipid metabolism
LVHAYKKTESYIKRIRKSESMASEKNTGLILAGSVLVLALLLFGCTAPGRENPVENLTNRSANYSGTAWTMEEIAKHNTSADCWMVLEDKVLNLSNFSSIHPGKAAYFHYCGRNGTAAYGEIYHSEEADAWTEEFAIGVVGEN